MAIDLTVCLPEIVKIAQEAGQILLSYLKKEALDIKIKSDQSPVSEADLASNKHIVNRLADLTPDIPIVTEESPESFSIPCEESRYWLIDPLDGTKEFIKGSDEFVVCIALIDRNRPVLGVIDVPVKSVTYYATNSQGAFKKEHQGVSVPIRVNKEEKEVIRVAVSKSHLNTKDEAYLKKLPNAVCVPIGSAYKFCRLAEGSIDLYFRHSPTMEWDTAAGQIIVEASGGCVIDHGTQKALVYGKNSLTNGGFTVKAEKLI